MENVQVFNVGDVVYFHNYYYGKMSGIFRGELDGKCCVVVNGQNWFFNKEELCK